jgi:signal transduction histidine kinase
VSDHAEEVRQHRLRYSLVVTDVGGQVHTLVVEEQPITVGRSPKATVCVPEEAVSRQHCMVTSTRGRLMLRDQGSTNGTRVNGKKVRFARLSHGDVVKVGGTRIRVQARTSPTWAEDDEQAGRDTGGDSEYPLMPHEQLSLLRRMAERIREATSALAVAEAALDTVMEVFPAQRALVVLADRAGVVGEESVFAARLRHVRAQPPAPLDSRVVQRVMRSGRAERHLIDPKKTVPDLGAADVADFMGPIICAPLRQGEGATGVLYLDAQRMPSWAGTGELLAFLTALADVLSVALSQRQLAADVDRFRDRQKGVAVPNEHTAVDVSASVVLQSARVDDSDLSKSRDVLMENQHIALAARLAELEHLQDTRTVLVRGLVHDIRNLVGALEANLSFVRMAVKKSPEETAALDAAMLCSKRIVAMAENVIDVSRMEEGTFPLKTQRVDVFSLMSEVLAHHVGQAREAEVVLRLGQVPSDTVVLVDGAVMGRVLDNLVDNALRYAGRGGCVHLESVIEPDGVSLIVTDSGPGVPPADRDRIFDQWSRGEATESKRHRGIGLYFCRLAVEAHGGTIQVDGEKRNNRFVVFLPSLDVVEEHTLTTSVGSNPRDPTP